MSDLERFQGIRARCVEKPRFPLLGRKTKVINLACGFAKVGNLAVIRLTQSVNSNVTGEIITRKKGVVFEQPNRSLKVKLSSMNKNPARHPFSLCSGEYFVLENGRETATIVNRRKLH